MYPELLLEISAAFIVNGAEQWSDPLARMGARISCSERLLSQLRVIDMEFVKIVIHVYIYMYSTLP